LWRNADGAVAPTVALSLTALIAAGGIAFDYAHLASLDTELQSAADQAALAAAAQLDGEDGACERAVSAARNMLANQTKMANDQLAVTIADPGVCNADTSITFNANASIRFYQDVGHNTPSTDDSNAKFVMVVVDDRVANYALTPVAAAFNSGEMHAQAYAGLDSAICKVPPLMLCNPNENADPDFTIGNYVGKGIRLVANDGGNNPVPGNFGFLATGYDSSGTNGAAVLRRVLGRTNVPFDCVSGDGVTTEPGNMINVRDALNTRFDMYENALTTGGPNSTCGSTGSGCPPSINSRKDLVRKANGCGFQMNGSGNGWREPDNNYPNRPIEASHALTDAQIATVAPMGYPRDICHAFGNNSVTGDCPPVTAGAGSRIGTGIWDRFAYFKSRSTGPNAEYPEVASMTTANTVAFNTFLQNNFGTTTPSRYLVYTTEITNRATRLRSNVNGGSGLTSVSQPVCSPPGVIPSATDIDRRVLSVAVINCAAENVHGRTDDVDVAKWIDIFLVEPSVARTRTVTRTENSDVYVEVIGATQNATDEGAVQLVKKSVPYLIE
jgi:Flp pilus assembly protein TadG